MTPEDRIARLARRLARERRRRAEAEEIAEAKTRRLYDANLELEGRNRELDAANEELRSILYTVTHDVRNPVVVLIGYLELWESDLADELDAERREELDMMLRSARYVRALIHDLLQLGRVGQAPSEARDVPLAEIVADQAASLSLQHGGVEVVAGPLPTLHADETQLRQLFANLIDNAVAHGGRGDIRIEVSARTTPGGGVDIDVADDGIGVGPAEREAIFGLFHRVARGRDADSTGVGLAICRKIVRGLGGDIHVEPSEVGATFRITLPGEVVVAPPS